MCSLSRANFGLGYDLAGSPLALWYVSGLCQFKLSGGHGGSLRSFVILAFSSEFSSVFVKSCLFVGNLWSFGGFFGSSGSSSIGNS